MSRAAARTVTRSAYPIDTRVGLMEADLDENDDRIDRLIAEVASIKKILVGILVSVTTGVIITALTGVISSGG